MLYTLVTDKNNYVVSVYHSKHDNVELDLTEIDTKYLYCYQFNGLTLILDEEKYEEEKKKEDEPSWEDKIGAQVLYTAMMTDTLLETEGEEDEL